MSLTKEECEIAIELIKKSYSEGEFQFDYDETKLLEQLINEHFELVENQSKIENTSGFKHFKMYSDSTLKSSNKDDLIDYIHMIYENWKSTDCFYKNAIDENYRLYNQLVELSRDVKAKDEYITELRNYINQIEREFKDNPPLKFEELKPNMWVFDNKYGIYIKIRSVKKKNSFIGYYQNFECNPETDESYENLQGIFFFEENRFYRREVEE